MPKSSRQPLDPPNQKKSATTSEPAKTPSVAAQVKSFVRNTLLASPEFPILYADAVISSAPNSYEGKILARNYKKIVERTHALIRQGISLNFDPTNPNSTNRTNMPNPKDCTHIKVTGVRCGSPALRGEQFCYFHQRMLRTVQGPPQSRIHHAALLEDEESIQASLMEVVNALLRGTIEVKRAELILRALNTAVRNIRRVHFGLRADDMVREIPTYPAVPDPEVEAVAAAEAARQATRIEIARVREEHLRAAQVEPATVRGGTGALARPGDPEVPGRSDPSTKKNAAIDPAQPKPPVSDRSAQVLQSRKQRAPSG
jgi:hypothetical protein